MLQGHTAENMEGRHVREDIAQLAIFLNMIHTPGTELCVIYALGQHWFYSLGKRMKVLGFPSFTAAN